MPHKTEGNLEEYERIRKRLDRVLVNVKTNEPVRYGIALGEEFAVVGTSNPDTSSDDNEPIPQNTEPGDEDQVTSSTSSDFVSSSSSAEIDKSGWPVLFFCPITGSPFIAYVKEDEIGAKGGGKNNASVKPSDEDDGVCDTSS